ncbi:heat shock protein, HSP20 family protein [Candidatus Magnetomorum sp. HK-1]|nr:heat shock protein, HSP20 family protein [Candidatus Magnetomorum sp. HK-1]
MKESNSKIFRDNIEGIFNGLSKIVNKIGDLATNAENIKTEGSFEGIDKKISGMYGVSVNFGIGDKGPKVEPFGNIRKDDNTGETVVHEIREPMVDIFDETEYTQVIVEMPGIAVDDITLELKEDILALYAEKGEKKYKKEILLSKQYLPSQMEYTCNNGILDIKFYLR